MRSAADEIVHHKIVRAVAEFLAPALKVGHRCDRDHSLEQFGVEYLRLQRGVAAVGPADDRQLAGCGDALVLQPAAGRVDVSDCGLPRLPAILVEPCDAHARGSAKVRLEYSVAPGRKILCEPVEAPFVARLRS